MLVLDTDHLSEWYRDSAAGRRLRTRLESSDSEMAVTVITLEEQMRGWLAELSRHNDPYRQIAPYAKLRQQVEVFADWTISPWHTEAADLFRDFRRQGVRIGPMDLKIASIVLAYECTLLTRNMSDFAKVAGLRFQNWLD